MRNLNLSWVERWTPDGPAGRCYCLGAYPAGEILGAYRAEWRDAVRRGRGPGLVVVTDDLGERVHLDAPALN